MNGDRIGRIVLDVILVGFTLATVATVAGFFVSIYA